MNRPTLSVTMIARNEAHNLTRALESVRPIADEIIVVDTGSTDDTVQVARQLGAKVYEIPWQDDFAGARNSGLEQCTGDWILSLDADEAVTAEFVRGLPGLLSHAKADAFEVTMVSYRNESTFVQRTAGVRLFRNRPWIRFRYRVHESITESILERGGRIQACPLEIEHFGYTADEDKRKGRRQRNVRLLSRSLEEEPDRYDLWFYLGAEYIQIGEVAEAKRCFRKKLEAPVFDNVLSGMAASSYAEILINQGEYDEAWRVARLGLSSPVAGADCAIRTVQAALGEGDYAFALKTLQEVEALPPERQGLLPRIPVFLGDLKARALWQQGERDQALDLWESINISDPVHIAITDRWVRHLFLAKGLRESTVGLIQRVRLVPVAAAVVGVLLRSGEVKLAADLSSSFADIHVPSIFFVHGLAKLGRWADAWLTADRAGLLGYIHYATAALLAGNDTALAQVRPELPTYLAKSLDAVLAGRKLAEDASDSLWMWMDQWASAGCYNLMQVAVSSLPEGQGAGEAGAAKQIFRAGNPQVAVEWASRWPEQPDSLEVLGLFAYDSGDMALAARLLMARVQAGPASVQVYHRAAVALKALRRDAEAQAVLKAGQQHRPLSLLLTQKI